MHKTLGKLFWCDNYYPVVKLAKEPNKTDAIRTRLWFVYTFDLQLLQTDGHQSELFQIMIYIIDWNWPSGTDKLTLLWMIPRCPCVHVLQGWIFFEMCADVSWNVLLEICWK